MWQNQYKPNEYNSFYKKSKSVFCIIIFSFLILLIKLFFLQILKTNIFQNISYKNMSYKEVVKANRGIIYDRNNKILVDNKPIYSIVINKKYLTYEEYINSLNSLKSFIPIDKNKFLKLFNQKEDVIIISNNIPKELIPLILENKIYIKGVDININYIRSYNLGNVASHIFGYLSEISNKKLALEYKNYKKGDIVGITGIEYQYENILRGKNGYNIFEIDALGNKKKLLEECHPIDGNNLKLTIDYDLQKFSEDLIKGKKGIIFVSDAKTNEILTFVSSPGYDPEQFLYDINEEKISTMNDPNFPMLNRITQGRYPPASTFKIIMTYAALAENIITPSFSVKCKGEYKIGNRIVKCWKWKDGGHGTLNLMEAIGHSCDIYFYELSKKLPPETIVKYAKIFGLDKKTGIDLPYEKKGFIPTPEWKKSRFKIPWYDGDTINMSIGQGFLLQTPIEMASMISRLVNYGKFDGFKISFSKKETINKHPVNLSKDVVDFIKKAMLETVNKRTGYNAFIKGLDICGKTGTAENSHGLDHAWFISFAPFSSPEVIVCVFIENEGGGAKIAAPIAKQVYKKYYELKNTKNSL